MNLKGLIARAKWLAWCALVLPSFVAWLPALIFAGYREGLLKYTIKREIEAIFSYDRRDWCEPERTT